MLFIVSSPSNEIIKVRHILILRPFNFFEVYLLQIHRCGASGSMRACHAAGPGSILGRDRFPG